MSMADLGAIIDRLAARLRALEANPRSEVTGGLQAVMFADLPTPGQPGRHLFVSDALKPLEAPGAGTGVTAVDDGASWLRVGDYTVIAA